MLLAIRHPSALLQKNVGGISVNVKFSRNIYKQLWKHDTNNSLTYPLSLLVLSVEWTNYSILKSSCSSYWSPLFYVCLWLFPMALHGCISMDCLSKVSCINYVRGKKLSVWFATIYMTQFLRTIKKASENVKLFKLLGNCDSFFLVFQFKPDLEHDSSEQGDTGFCLRHKFLFTSIEM